MSTTKSIEVASLHLVPSRPPHLALAALAASIEVFGQVLLIAVTVTFAVLFPYLFTRRAPSS